MHIVLTLTVLAATKNCVMAELKEASKEFYPKTTTIKALTSGHSTSSAYSVKFNPRNQSLWKLSPGSHNVEYIVNDTQTMGFRPPISLTRIAKSRNYGFDPYFKKGNFEPFETRPKPITLVAFRKNGLVPRQSIKVKAGKSSEAAELQSPYNDVGQFWQDDFGQS